MVCDLTSFMLYRMEKKWISSCSTRMTAHGEVHMNGRKFMVVIVCPLGGGQIQLVEQDDIDVFTHFIAMYMADEFHLLQL